MVISGNNLTTTNNTIISNEALQTYGFKNYIINGNFDVWQRGTSFSTYGSFIYSSDRWWGYNYVSGSTMIQQAFTPGQTSVPGEPTYFLRVTTGGTDYWIGQKIEDVRTLAGKTVTLSFYAKASTSMNITGRFTNSFGSGGSADANLATTNFTLTTSWQKFTWTYTIDSISGKTIGAGSSLNVWFNGSQSSAGTTIDIAKVQLEQGTVATPFEQRPYGLELSLCQRYYETLHYSSNGYAAVSSIQPVGTNNRFNWKYTEKRASPTISLISGAWINSTPSIFMSVDQSEFYSSPTYFFAQGTSNAVALAASAEL